MNDADPDEAAGVGGRGGNTLCPTCRGAGMRRVPRAAVYRGQFGTAIVEETCQPCDGSGWLVDLQPPA